MNILRYLKKEHGSVMLEFCLVLPIYLLLFGGTFLIFDITMARLHLQEANRNLAWIQNDRYDLEGKINERLYKNVTDFFEARNALERKIGDVAIWSFGKDYEDYQNEKSKHNGSKTQSNSDLWGHYIERFEDSDSALELNNGWASFLGLDVVFDNDYIAMRSGNMELKMEKVSAVYIGAVGVASVLYPNDETDSLYAQFYTFTRATDKQSRGANSSERSASRVNTEMLLLRRNGTDCRENINTLNILQPSRNLFIKNTIFRSWPSSGILGDIQLFLGVKL